ncbi:MAG TPA: universal stress protein [Candidatus Acidoferrales bacterium]|nr:universal stress protein [Candidatus Acidoferrales bacterium]
MTTLQTGSRITFKNVLLLTDFSEPSEAALPFAMGVARTYGAKLHAFHVLLPTPSAYYTPEFTVAAIESDEERAQAEMQRIESQLSGLPHDVSIERDIAVWPSLEREIADDDIDLLVLGTHGRTGAQKFLLGSVAEEIFRRSDVPVLTIGPGVRSRAHNDARFHRVLFATDFSAHSLAAWPYALSLAQENQAHLILLHVVPEDARSGRKKHTETSPGDAQSRLEGILPKDADLWCRPEVIVDRGEPRIRIAEIAKNQGADLIVLGVRSASRRLAAATHLERAIAHNVVAHAGCPVLTARG